MSTMVTTGNLLNPTSQGLAYGMFPGGSMSQYLDAYSVFDTTGSAYTGNVFGTGYGYGYGGVNMIANNNAYYDYMGVNSDNMTSLAFKNRSNQHALGSYNEIIQKNMAEMASAIREGEFGKASSIYNEVYTAISKNYGEELMTQSQRLEADQSIKATITNLYAQVNGYSLVADIEESGEGYFANGFMQGLTLGNHHKNSAEETESYMTGAGIENYSGKKLQKNIGKLIGGAVSVGGSIAAGAAIGSFIPGIGTAIGAAVGGTIALGTWLFSDNSPSKVTKA
ncbi:MAG: hypothetical protein LUB59_01865 [Candidatus Gastranaerophilales bacterium]|nr:hypothetical protein [Candidatus Gastranaerophilales bacterium]